MVQLIDNEVCQTLSWYTTIAFPACWVGFFHINNGTASAITADRFGKDARCLAVSDIESIELTFEVSLHSSCPSVVSTRCKFHLLIGFSTSSCLIKAKRWLRRRVEAEGCFARRIRHLVESLLCNNVLREYESSYRCCKVVF